MQAKAQAELDAVIGSDRLPGFSDRESLPYINAFALELLRWHAVVPTGEIEFHWILIDRRANMIASLGVPHRVTEDDIHNGFLIPKGSLVIPNVW